MRNGERTSHDMAFLGGRKGSAKKSFRYPHFSAWTRAVSGSHPERNKGVRKDIMTQLWDDEPVLTLFLHFSEVIHPHIPVDPDAYVFELAPEDICLVGGGVHPVGRRLRGRELALREVLAEGEARIARALLVTDTVMVVLRRAGLRIEPEHLRAGAGGRILVEGSVRPDAIDVRRAVRRRMAENVLLEQQFRVLLRGLFEVGARHKRRNAALRAFLVQDGEHLRAGALRP